MLFCLHFWGSLINDVNMFRGLESEMGDEVYNLVEKYYQLLNKKLGDYSSSNQAFLSHATVYGTYK